MPVRQYIDRGLNTRTVSSGSSRGLGGVPALTCAVRSRYDVEVCGPIRKIGIGVRRRRGACHGRVRSPRNRRALDVVRSRAPAGGPGEHHLLIPGCRGNSRRNCRTLLSSPAAAPSSRRPRTATSEQKYARHHEEQGPGQTGRLLRRRVCHNDYVSETEQSTSKSLVLKGQTKGRLKDCPDVQGRFERLEGESSMASLAKAHAQMQLESPAIL